MKINTSVAVAVVRRTTHMYMCVCVRFVDAEGAFSDVKIEEKTIFAEFYLFLMSRAHIY